MYFHLRSEIEKTSHLKNYLIKRISCPTCGKLQIRKIFQNHFYTKYKCWNKNCKNKDIPFVLINEYLKNENNFKSTCEKCNQDYYREFRENDKITGKLMFKCVNSIA